MQVGANYYSVIKMKLFYTVLLAAIAANEVCFDSLGCFSDAYPYSDGLHRPSRLPDHPSKINTVFTLYTTVEPRGTTEIVENMITNANTVFVTHGWRDNVDGWVHDAVSNLLNLPDPVNVITADWRQGANILDYAQAATNTRLVGRQIVLLIENILSTKKLLSPSSIQLVGHSLGGQTAGYAGKFYNERHGDKIGKITGLDPAGPMFEIANMPDRDRHLTHLYRSDATFVDVIHTTGGPLTEVGLGMSSAIGHADFYPNGGEVQNGCHLPGCHHSRAYQYWISSVKRNCFQAWSCDSYEAFANGACSKSVLNTNRMGYYSTKPLTHNSFFLDTTGHVPYCK